MEEKRDFWWDGMKFELPIFWGHDVEGWIFGIERYFRIFRLTEEEQLDMAINCFKGAALEWYQCESPPFYSWRDLRWMLLDKFRHSDSGVKWDKRLTLQHEENDVDRWKNKIEDGRKPLGSVEMEILDELQRMVKMIDRMLGRRNQRQQKVPQNKIDFELKMEELEIRSENKEQVVRRAEEQKTAREEDSDLFGEQYIQLKSVPPITIVDDNEVSMTEMYGRTNENEFMAHYVGHQMDVDELNLMHAEPIWPVFVNQPKEPVQFEKGKGMSKSGQVEVIDIYLNHNQDCPTDGGPQCAVKRVMPQTGIPNSMPMTTPAGSNALPSSAVAVLQPNEAVFGKETEGLPLASSVGKQSNCGRTRSEDFDESTTVASRECDGRIPTSEKYILDELETKEMDEFLRSLPASKEKDILLKAIAENQIVVFDEAGWGKASPLSQYIRESKINVAHGLLCLHQLGLPDTLVVGTRNGSMRFIDVARGQTLHWWSGDSVDSKFPSLVTTLCSSGSDKMSAECGSALSTWIASGHYRLFAARSGKILASQRDHNGYVTHIAAPEVLRNEPANKEYEVYVFDRGKQKKQFSLSNLEDKVDFRVGGNDTSTLTWRRGIG